ncbi:MAG: endonuclease III [Campylobacterales bacterium]
MTKREKEIKKRLLEQYSDSKTELEYANIYELCVAVMLSAQCTDKRVNIITPALFKKYPDTSSLASANLEDIKEFIKSCSFFNNKAKNLLGFAKQVEERLDGVIPNDRDTLMSLPGIGRKTANVISIEYSEQNYMAVDTHVFRVSHRLGLSSAKNVLKTEEDLTKKFKTDLHILHQGMVLFGRYICKAKNPVCQSCFLEDMCRSKKSFKPA